MATAYPVDSSRLVKLTVPGGLVSALKEKVIPAERTYVLFSPGICWSGLRVNRLGSIVHRLQMNS